MSPPAPRDIQQAVVAWHNSHPLAARIDSSQVHSIGWVALPFLRPPQGVEPTLDAPPRTPTLGAAVPPKGSGWRRWLPAAQRAPHAPWPVFSEAFIDGLSARRAAAFAALHGSAEAPTNDAHDWPQRRIDVDGDLAEKSAGGWPVELWLISAAIDVGKERRRVLVGADGVAVAGPRHWRRLALQAIGLVAVAASVGAALALWGWGGSPPASTAIAAPPVALNASGALGPASAQVAASTPPGPASASAAPMDPASEPSPLPAEAQASIPASPAIAPSAPASTPTGDEPAPDIRPQLVKPLPNRRGATPPPMLSKLGGSKPEAAQPPALEDSAASASTAPATVGSSSPPRADGPYRGAATPEQLRPGLPAQGPLIALVSPGSRSKAEAEAMLGRMTEHLKATMAQQAGLRGEVIETPEGWRAAVYPFATREEAAILNATMVARGWRTRSVTF